MDVPCVMSGDYNTNMQRVISSATDVQYKAQRLNTGISKPSIVSSISPQDGLSVPNLFPANFMHIILNITNVILDIFCGTVDCDTHDSKWTWDWAVLQGPVWQKHGKQVAYATPYLPRLFDRPPRNPAEKIFSGYKAWEYLMYIFGLGPAMFYQVVPKAYWQHFCKLTTAICIFHHDPSPSSTSSKPIPSLLTMFISLNGYIVNRRLNGYISPSRVSMPTCTSVLKFHAPAPKYTTRNGQWNVLSVTLVKKSSSHQIPMPTFHSVLFIVAKSTP